MADTQPTEPEPIADAPPAVLPTAPPAPSVVPPRRRAARAIGIVCVWLLTLLVVAAAVDAGLKLRRWVWEQTGQIHFLSDINRGYQWGREASGPQGLVNVYDKMAGQKANAPYFLDYAPLRLAVMRQWTAINARSQDRPQDWRADYAFNRPVLWFNAGFELVGAVAAFFIVRRWARLSRRPPPARSWPGEWLDRVRGRTAAPPPTTPLRPFAGWGRGLIAALLLWFNPAMILSTHGWPTWDAWVIPMFLLALLATTYDRWFLAGVAIGVGTMFKGQQLVGAPVFLAWTLLNGDWRNALRWTAGVGVAVAVVALPWLTTVIPQADLVRLAGERAAKSARDVPFVVPRVWNTPAIVWAAAVGVMAVLLPSAWRTGDWRWRAGAAAMAGVLVLCPLALRNGLASVYVLTQALVVLVVLAATVRRATDRAILAVAAVAGALFGGIYFFDASPAWWQCGIAYGSDHYQVMIAGLTDNLPALLHERFGWNGVDDVVFTWQRPVWLPGAAGVVPVTVKMFTRGLFVLLTLPFLWAVARHARRRDPRLLVAVVAPWLVFFCIPTQIHERYLLYAAAMASLWIGQSVGMTLLGLFLTLTTFVQALSVMLVQFGAAYRFGPVLHELAPDWFSKNSGLTLLQNLRATYPDLAWAHLLALAVVMYVALTSTRRRADAGPPLASERQMTTMPPSS